MQTQEGQIQSQALPTVASQTLPSYRVVIIGGGSAGIDVAARLARALPQGSVAIIEPSRKHYYQPLWTLVGGGVFPKQNSERDEVSLIPQGVTWMRDAVTEFLPEENAVVTQGGKRIKYDFLVVAAGIQIDWGKIKGLQDVLGKDVVWHIPGEGEWAGDIQGRDALIALWTGVADEGSSQSFDLHDVLANDEHAVALANVTMNRRDKGSLQVRSVWIFHCSGGKITEGWFFDENPAATSAFWS